MDYSFSLREADTGELGQCATSNVALRDWLESLPLANIGECARRIYSCSQELATLRTEPSLRLEMLDTLRPTVYYICDALSKHFLNQPPLLQDKQAKVASLAQSLQGNLAEGYIRCAQELSQERANGDRRLQIAQAVHRGIADLSRVFLRACQIYSATPAGLWLHMHQLYALAEDLRLTGETIVDPQNRNLQTTSIADAYKRCLLLGCARPSQLRQRSLAMVFEAGERWAALTELHDHTEADDIFIVQRDQDTAPCYRSKGEAAGASLALGLQRLVGALVSHLASIEDGKVSSTVELVPKEIPSYVLDHLIATWSAEKDRLEPRRAVDSPAQVCVGLTAVQYFLSGQVDFDLQMTGGVGLHSGSKNPFLDKEGYRVQRTTLNPDNDGWSKAFDAGHGGFGDIDVSRLEQVLGTSAVRKYKKEGIHKIIDLADKVPTQPVHHPRMLNRSPGGCCLQWQDDASDRLQEGQLVAIREAGEPSWILGMVRWIQRCDERSLQTGLRYIANNATVCGAAVSFKERSRIEFMRAIELPGMEASGEAPSLILPNTPFKPEQKIFINRLGRTSKAVLGRARLTTSCFTQFDFRELDLAAPAPQKPAQAAGTAEKKGHSGPASDDPFDSIWEDI